MAESNATKSTSPESSSEALSFEERAHIWFEKNRQMVIYGCVAIILVAAVFILMYWQHSAKTAAARNAMASAKTVVDWEKIVASWPQSEAAPRALLLVANEQYRAGKYDEAIGTQQRFLRDYPRNEFASSAQYGIAASLEAKGDFAAAVDAYDAVRSGYPESMHIGEAMIGKARCLEALGKQAEAKQIYEDVMASMPNTQWQMEAMQRLAAVNRKLKPLPTTAEPTPIPSLLTPPAPASQPAVPNAPAALPPPAAQ